MVKDFPSWAGFKKVELHPGDRSFNIVYVQKWIALARETLSQSHPSSIFIILTRQSIVAKNREVRKISRFLERLGVEPSSRYVDTPVSQTRSFHVELIVGNHSSFFLPLNNFSWRCNFHSASIRPEIRSFMCYEKKSDGNNGPVLFITAKTFLSIFEGIADE